MKMSVDEMHKEEAKGRELTDDQLLFQLHFKH